MKTKIDGKSHVDSYIKKISDNCDFNYFEVENMVLTQLALTLGDLAVKGKSQSPLGELTVDKYNKINLNPNDFLLGVLRGEIDPLILLNEYLNRS